MPFDALNFNTSQVVKDLEMAKNLIGTPSAWCRGQMQAGAGDHYKFCARGALAYVVGMRVHPASERVPCYHHCYHYEDEEKGRRFRQASAVLDDAARARGKDNGAMLNNYSEHGHEDVMAMFDAAIAKARASARVNA